MAGRPSFTLSYDCTFYALLALSTREAELKLHHGRCVMNPLKKVRFSPGLWGSLSQGGCPSLWLLTCHKLRDNLEDDSFFKSLGSRLFLPFVSRKAKKAAGEYPFLAQQAQKAMEGQAQAEKEGAGVDACAEPTANLLAALFKELACDEMQAVALERFGYFLGRWVYLIDAADDLGEDLRGGAPLTPLSPGWASPARRSSPKRSARRRTEACNQALNATAAQMLLAFNLLDLRDFGPHFGERGDKGPAGNPAGNLVLHIREKKKKRPEPEDLR